MTIFDFIRDYGPLVATAGTLIAGAVTIRSDVAAMRSDVTEQGGKLDSLDRRLFGGNGSGEGVITKILVRLARIEQSLAH